MEKYLDEPEYRQALDRWKKIAEPQEPTRFDPSSMKAGSGRPSGEFPHGLAVPGHDILGELGRGGMGVVFRAFEPDLGRTLAVKVLLECHKDNPLAVRRFLEEARVCGRLQHPGVPPVHELGALPSGLPFFTMRLVEGHTLADLLAARDALDRDLPRFVSLFEQICQTVAFAHARGVIHRDLKPANVMVGAFGEVQVMDWGLAKD